MGHVCYRPAFVGLGGRVRRFALVCALATVVAGVALSGASGASFDDSTPCPTVAQFFTCPGGTVGQPYSVQLKGKGGCDLYWFEVVNSSLPSGLSMNTSGVISGVPTAAGRAEFFVHIHDLTPSEGGFPWCGGDNPSQKQFVITIEPGLSITNQSVKPGTVGEVYSETLKASQVVSTNPFTGTEVPASWLVQSGTLPPGVTLSTAGLLEGTPTTEGTYQFVVAAFNGSQADTETLTVTVRQPVLIASPFANPAKPPKLEVGVPFDATLTATGGTGTYTWAIASGALPDGLTFGTDATITGSPLESGSFPFAITATDTEGRVTTLTATLVVAAELSIKTLRLRAAKVGRLYTQKLATLGGVEPVRWKLVRGTLPRGIRFAKKLGVFAGTTRRKGTYRVTVQVSDALGVTSQTRFTLTVLP